MSNLEKPDRGLSSSHPEATLPPGWMHVCLSTLVDTGPSNGLYVPKKKYGSGTPILRIADYQDDWSRSSHELQQVDIDAATADKFALHSDDVVINRVNSLTHLGKCLVVEPRHLPAVFESNMMRLRLDPSVHPAFVVAWLRSMRGRKKLTENAKWAVNQASINQGDVTNTIVPVAPLPEQHRIVAEIEKQFTRLDDAVATLEKVQVKLQAARASVLKAAVEGRLVPTEAELARAEGRSYEPADVLLERVLAERKANAGKGKYKPPVEPDTEGLPELPEGWVWASVDQCCAEVTDGDHQPPPVTPEGVPFLVIGDVKSGSLNFDGCRRVPADYFAALAEKRRPDSADLLYTVTGSFGIPVRIPDDREFCVQRHIAILKAPFQSAKDYLFHAMASPRFFEAASAAATGTAQKTVGLKSLRALAVPLPPAAEQTRIVAEVERRLSVLDALGQTVETNLRRLTRLRQSILKRAFEGKLVPQDPNDEPASELLARIQAS